MVSSGPSEPQPMGRLVDVGGYRLHLACQGDGSPTVVMEAAIGETGLLWSLVQPAVAKLTRACVYDRAGYGWSDPTPGRGPLR
jgi:pimeloyl-ACP methyl ester carboxylesterase